MHKGVMVASIDSQTRPCLLKVHLLQRFLVRLMYLVQSSMRISLVLSGCLKPCPGQQAPPALHNAQCADEGNPQHVVSGAWCRCNVLWLGLQLLSSICQGHANAGA